MKNQQNHTKETFLQNLIIQLAHNSRYSKSIFTKYAFASKQFEKYKVEVGNAGASIMDKALKQEGFEGVTREKLGEYIQTDKMPPKIRPEIEAVKNSFLNIINEKKIELPTFNWIELRYMNVGLVDVLKTYELVDNRKFMWLFKPQLKQL